MTGIRKTKAAACLLLSLACTVCSSTSPAQEEPDDPVIQMVVELLSDADRDMRAVGLQQVREEVPGEATTKKFAELLPKLAPEAQASLLEALGDRGDAAARPAVVMMLLSQEEAVRAAALRALGTLGNTSDVVLLALKAAAGSKREKGAARLSLVRLRGDAVNATMVAALAVGGPKARVELLGVLAARSAKETLPTIIASVEDPEASVRLAALEALRMLADESHVAALVELLKAAREDQQRRKTVLALLAVCSRAGEACADGIIAGLADADVPSRVALLDALARAGGAKALEEVVARLEDDGQAVRDEAVRMLAAWPETDAVEHLLAIASAGDSLRHRVLAIRGLVSLASPREEMPADLKILADVMSLAKRPQEKLLVLGVLGGVATAESLELVTSAMDQSALADEAGLAAVMIAEKIEQGDRDKIRAAMEKVVKGAKDQRIRERARKVLDLL